METIPRVRLMKSVGLSTELPSLSGDEYCLLGRSNVGKSSFINHVFADRTLARVSRTPGKTTLANIYALDDGTYWTDLPGYGYAKVSYSERERMNSLIRHYCTERKGLRGILWLVDIRHPGLQIDRDAWAWISARRHSVLVVLTKADTVSRSEASRLVREHRRFYGDSEMLLFSVRLPGSRDNFWKTYWRWRTRHGLGSEKE